MDYESASGTVEKRIDNLLKGTAVNNAAEKLNTFAALPEITNGRIIAGSWNQLPTINRLKRSVDSQAMMQGKTAC